MHGIIGFQHLYLGFFVRKKGAVSFDTTPFLVIVRNARLALYSTVTVYFSLKATFDLMSVAEAAMMASNLPGSATHWCSVSSK